MFRLVGGAHSKDPNSSLTDSSFSSLENNLGVTMFWKDNIRRMKRP